jgi:hypothetical protein
MPAMARKLYTDENLGHAGARLGALDHRVAARARPHDLQQVDDPLHPLAHRGRDQRRSGRQKGEQIRYHMGQGTFKDVLVSQAIRPTSKEGAIRVDPDDLMPPNYHLQTIAEKRFGGRIARLSRIVSIDPSRPRRRSPRPAPYLPSPLRSISELQSASEPAVAALTSAALSR